MHGAVGDARCAVRQRAVDDGLPLDDVRGGPRPLLGKRGWSVRLSALRCLAGHAARPHRQSPTHLVVIPEQVCRHLSTIRSGITTRWVIRSPSPVQNQLSLAQVDFSLELPLPNRKRKLEFHYSFWNFRSQIEKRKLEFYYSFWNLRSQIEKRKLEFHYSFWNLRSQIEKPKFEWTLQARKNRPVT